ncbi:hypothetical protein HMPREF9440_00566 [Sutterella parvirubra YIT 11816]|uniref:Uncharacterized protein n=1 Tax=Sutterella parvirubra YIT 11816 TaxID=762967 RepID=H3KCW3_9BURK|nr:hypothetical protein HMPREF9440_00566 [Sutterella parvirubra YIT 11816]
MGRHGVEFPSGMWVTEGDPSFESAAIISAHLPENAQGRPCLHRVFPRAARNPDPHDTTFTHCRGNPTDCL